MLNIPRVHLRQAVNYLQGVKCAQGAATPFAMFDAIAMSEEEAELLQDDSIARQAVEEAMREARG